MAGPVGQIPSCITIENSPDLPKLASGARHTKTIAISAAATALLIGLAPMPASAQAVPAPTQKNAAQPAPMDAFKSRQLIEAALVMRGEDGHVAFYSGAGIGRSTVTAAHVVGNELTVTVVGGHGRKFSCPLNALGGISVDSDNIVHFRCGLAEQAFLTFAGNDGPMAGQVAAALRVLESNAGPLEARSMPSQGPSQVAPQTPH